MKLLKKIIDYTDYYNLELNNDTLQTHIMTQTYDTFLYN